MTKTHTKKHKRCTAPFPHSGGSWIHTDGKLVQEEPPVTAASETPGDTEHSGTAEPSADATSSDPKRGRRFGGK